MFKTKTFRGMLAALALLLAFPISAFAGDWGSLPQDPAPVTSASRAVPMAQTRALPRAMNHIYHVAHGTPYHVENSVTGLIRAKRAGYRVIDFDAQITRDNVVVVTHWGYPMKRDGFYDPAGKLKRNRSVASMTLEQVMRLRTRDGYRIYPAQTMFAAAKARGIAVSLEVKGDRRFERVEIMDSLKRAQVATGATVRISTLSNLGKYPQLRLRAARQAGFSSIILAHSRVPAAWVGDIDYVRGPMSRLR